MKGNGTPTNPFDLVTALGADNILTRPGDTLWLSGGTYAGDFINTRSGTASKRLTIRAIPGERPIIDGSMVATGAYVTWIGIEFSISAYTDRAAGDDLKACVAIGGEDNRFIGCIFHDGYQGIIGGSGCVNYEITDCVFYHNGNNSGLGHGLYIQHLSQAGIATIRNNIVFSNFAYGFHIYGTQPINNFFVSNNISFHNGSPRNDPARNILCGGSEGGDGSVVTKNMLYHQMEDAQNLNVGYGAGNSVTDCQITDNFSANAKSALYTTDCVTPVVTGNYLYGSTLKIVGGVQYDAKADYPLNTFGASDEWIDTVFVVPSIYFDDRAHVAIYNKSGADSVTVDLTSVTELSIGDAVTAWNVQAGVGNDLQTLTLDANKCITVNMQAANRSVAAPVGWDAPATTFPTFGCFVVNKA